MIDRALGRKGTYSGGRCAVAHTGKLSYVGPRKNGKVRQPYVAEGPNESSANPESKFWYHRKHICHSYWPFVHGLCNYLVWSATLVAYYMYRHLACFHPVSNDPQNRKKFCPRAIIDMVGCVFANNMLLPIHIQKERHWSLAMVPLPRARYHISHQELLGASFSSWLFSHWTFAPIYIVDERAYFRKCPHITMFSWGGLEKALIS